MRDELVITTLARLTPPADDALPDWQNVLDRAQSPTSSVGEDAFRRNGSGTLDRRSRRRERPRRVPNRRKWLAISTPLVVLLGSLALLTPVGPAVARTLDGFASWLSGSPGEPAATSEQRAFARATRSWTGFPAGTELRRLAETRASGSTFTLYGFRGAGSLCLRLDVTGAEAARELSCPPLSELKAREHPALVVAADYGVGSSKPDASERAVHAAGSGCERHLWRRRRRHRAR